MQQSEFKISISVESYDEKLMKLLPCGKAHSFQTIKDILIAQIEDLNADRVKISRSYIYSFQEIRRQRASRPGHAPVRRNSLASSGAWPSRSQLSETY